MLGELGYTGGNWSITLVDDRAMGELHARTMGDARTTDVLTFDLRGDDDATGLDLDTVICVAEARRQAAARGHAVHDEVLLYAVHSLLHVSGYDDLTPRQARAMHAREDELLTRLGVGAVYARERR